MIYIYCLIDPRNDRVFYVGQSINPNKRLRNHISVSRSSKVENPHKERVIKSILNDSFEPKVEILSEHKDQISANKSEIQWINSFSNLTNVSTGGNFPPRLSGEKSPSYKGKLPTKTCIMCGKEFEVSNHTEIRYLRSKFCSKECQFKTGREEIKCCGCGSLFEVEKYRKKKYCSAFCKENNSILYFITSPSRECYLSTNLKDFCKTHNLRQPGLAKVFSERLPHKQYLGWSGVKVM